MYKLFRQTLAIFVLGSLLTGCSVTDKITAKFKKPSELSAITALDAKSTEALKNSKDLKHPVRVHLSYAKWKEETGDFEEAEKSYRLVLNLQSDNDEARLGLARVLMQRGQVSDAGELFQSELKKTPDDPQVLLNVSQFYAEQSDWNQATQLLKRAAQLEPQNKDIQFHLAVALANAGDIRGAYTQFRTVLSERDSHYNLGKILVQRGDQVSAERHFARVLEIDPDFKPAQEMMARLQPNQQPQTTQYASRQFSRPEQQRTIPANAERSSSQQSKPFKPVFNYSEESKPAF
jgi:Tfp pilus assembly protein PilF